MDYDSAKRRVKAIKGFYVHLSVYLIVIGGLFLLNQLTGGSWWYWPALGWGIGLVIHFMSVFLDEGLLGSDWEDKKIKQMMSRQIPK